MFSSRSSYLVKPFKSASQLSRLSRTVPSMQIRNTHLFPSPDIPSVMNLCTFTSIVEERFARKLHFYKSHNVFQNIKHDSTKSSSMQYSVSLSLLCPSLSFTLKDQARYIINRLLAKQSYLQRCCQYWQDLSHSSAAVLDSSNDVLSHLFLPA